MMENENSLSETKGVERGYDDKCQVIQVKWIKIACTMKVNFVMFGEWVHSP